TFTATQRPAGWFANPVRDLNTTVSTRIVDRNLRTPYQDEWRLGFEREIAPETAVAITYIHRSFRDQLQDIDLNHLPHDYGRCITRAPWVDTSKGPDGKLDDCYGGRDGASGGPDGIPDLYVQNPGWGDVLLVGNFNTAEYKATELRIERRFFRG